MIVGQVLYIKEDVRDNDRKLRVKGDECFILSLPSSTVVKVSFARCRYSYSYGIAILPVEKVSETPITR